VLRSVRVPDAFTKVRTAADHAAIDIRWLSPLLEHDNTGKRVNAERDAGDSVPSLMIGVDRRLKGFCPRTAASVSGGSNADIPS
jgi:hypothetical protein